MDVDRQFETLTQLIKKTVTEQGYLSARATIKQDAAKPEIYWVNVTGISKKFNLKANYKLTVRKDNTLAVKFQYCSPRVASHEIERAMCTFNLPISV